MPPTAADRVKSLTPLVKSLDLGGWHDDCFVWVTIASLWSYPMKFAFLKIALAGCALANTAAAAPQFQDLAAIDAAVVGATGEQIGQVGGAIGPVDRRLKLARCPEPVQVDPAALGAVAVRCAPLGWRVRITLVAPTRPAEPVQKAPEVAEMLVKRGEAVELRVVGAGFQVSGAAVAMDDGARGKTIRVKSPTSKTPVSATVIGPAIVKISL